MKKILIILIVLCLFVTGCRGDSESSVLKSIEKKFNNSSGYKLNGKLSVNNNDDVYNYNVEVLYKKKDNYRVKLTNTASNLTQIILKNSDGVYVLTPSLNKSFRFQSDWPYNNSQIYLLDAVINDIKKDNNRKYKKINNKYVFTTKVNYPNNSKLKEEKIVFSNKKMLEKVSVYDKNGVEAMSMSFDKIKYSPKYNKNDFKIDSIIDKKNIDEVKETSSLEDVIYPLFLPKNTKLVSEEKVKKTNGERVIMNYDGDKSFLLVEETADVFNEFTIIPSSGEPFIVMDTLGVMTNNSLSWTSGGIDYYLVSEVMNQDEMLEVAQSINGIVSIK